MQKKPLYLLGGAIPFTAGAAFLAYSYTLSLGTLGSPGPGLWPFIASLVIILGSATLLITERDYADYERFSGGLKAAVVGIISLCLYVALFRYWGFIMPTFLVTVVWLRLLGGESWVLTFSVALASTLGFYILFDRTLQVPFPEDLLGALVGL